MFKMDAVSLLYNAVHVCLFTSSHLHYAMNEREFLTVSDGEQLVTAALAVTVANVLNGALPLITPSSRSNSHTASKYLCLHFQRVFDHTHV